MWNMQCSKQCKETKSETIRAKDNTNQYQSRSPIKPIFERINISHSLEWENKWLAGWKKKELEYFEKD